MIGKRLEGSDAKWDVYLDIFTGLTWILISLTLLALAAGLVILSEKERSGKLKILGNQNWQWFDEDDQNLTFMEGISISLKMLFNLDFRMTLREPSARIMIFVGSFMGYLFYAFYTADLTAWMTSNPPPLPIRSCLSVTTMH